MLTELPAEIQSALGALTPALIAAHLSPMTWEFSEKEFGNFLVVFHSPSHKFTLTRDRGQFIVSGFERKSLENQGLWRAFDTAEDLLPHLSRWLGQ